MDEARILVVYGLSGAGKSQLVLNYVREHRQDYAGVFWIEAGSKETLARDYIQVHGLLYGRMASTGQDLVKLEDAVPAVKRWFQSRRDGLWLVVLDSADAIDNEEDASYIDLRYFVPDGPKLHVVVTTRSSTAQEMTPLDPVQVGELEPSEAIELFQRTAKMAAFNIETTEEIGRIVKDLGYLALAVTLAGSYVSMTPRLKSDVKRYLPEYKRRRKELLQRRPKRHVHQYGESVLSTWETSFEAITNQDPTAARLLSLLAFVNFEDITVDLFSRDLPCDDFENKASHSQTVWWSFLFETSEWTGHNLESCFETLQDYSLLQWKADQDSYAMHKLVHAWSYDRLDADVQKQLSRLSLDLIAEATKQEHIGPSRQVRIVPHLMAGFELYSQLYRTANEISLDLLKIVETIASFLTRIGRWQEAYTVRLFHTTNMSTLQGKEHPDALTSTNDLALLLDFQGKYNEAETIHRQTLALRQSILGKEHPDTLTSMANLASIYRKQGRWKEAEKLEVQVMEINKRMLNKKHPNTLNSIINLVLTYKKQKRWKKAEKLQIQVMETRKKMISKKHLNMLINMINLASIYWNQGRWKETEKLNMPIMKTKKRVLGEKHLFTLINIINLVLIYRKQGRWKETEELKVQIMKTRKRMLGEEHPNTLTNMTNLVSTYWNQGR